MKKQYKVYKKYKKIVQANQQHDEGFKALANTLLILSKNSNTQPLKRKIINDSDENSNLRKCIEIPTTFLDEQRNKISKAASKIIYYATKFPHIYY